MRSSRTFPAREERWIYALPALYMSVAEKYANVSARRPREREIVRACSRRGARVRSFAACIEQRARMGAEAGVGDIFLTTTLKQVIRQVARQVRADEIFSPQAGQVASTLRI